MKHYYKGFYYERIKDLKKTYLVYDKNINYFGVIKGRRQVKLLIKNAQHLLK